ncbi:tripartite ATP-independent transporter DctM subunit [Hoeflea marina]|uniref:TRAP transporter large permease protein n=1 Tax=Hoeflea marina TaxID=274592 RepID=A0A317PNI2_9HYPH|nr:TRAP transporter large permease [Hoeflea marina]PWW00617.1 tripartite ATP-independent transporter DctM subunit [Hoeflea marina]
MSTLLLALGLIFVLMALRVPVAVSIGLAAMTATAAELGWRVFPVSAQVMVDGISSFVLIAAPFFMLAGEIMNRGGLTQRIFRLANALVGSLPGGLGQVNVMASMLFAGMTGSAISDAVGLGTMEIRAMKERGYDARLSASITAASSIIGPMIPPSVPIVIYGALAGVSIGSLFLAGLVPGILMGVALMLAILVYDRLGLCPREPRAPGSELRAAALAAVPSLALPVLVVGGIYSGLFTPTEAAVVSSAYAAVLALIYGELRIADFKQIITGVASATGALFLIVATTALLGWIVTRSGVMIEVALWLGGAVDSQTQLLLIVAGLCLVVGLFMEPIAALVLLVPILLPAVKILQIDLVHFGIVLILALMIGLLTPPVGLILFVVARIAEISITQMIRGIAPLLLVLVTVLLLIIVFPTIVMFLPRLAYGLPPFG